MKAGIGIWGWRSQITEPLPENFFSTSHLTPSGWKEICNQCTPSRTARAGHQCENTNLAQRSKQPHEAQRSALSRFWLDPNTLRSSFRPVALADNGHPLPQKTRRHDWWRALPDRRLKTPFWLLSRNSPSTEALASNMLFHDHAMFRMQ